MGKETGATVGKDQLDAEPTDIDRLSRSLQIRIVLTVLGEEARAPVDVDIALSRPAEVFSGAD
jgi:hypothetical protein